MTASFDLKIGPAEKGVKASSRRAAAFLSAGKGSRKQREIRCKIAPFALFLARFDEEILILLSLPPHGGRYMDSRT
jgi:hypothetical protein